jgi:cellulose synthase/poly-beta-1,6-N-acetylglucosamine synthase-like glycosyltransferase
MLFLVASIFVLYGALLVWLRLGIRKIQNQPLAPDAHQIRMVSVLVAFRNEAAHLGALVNDLRSQSYPAFSYEVVLVDDHSTDGSYELVQRLVQGDARFRVARLPAGRVGKKAALAEGIRVSKGELILTTDADCRVPETWCKTMNAMFEIPAVKMCLGPVRMLAGSSFIQQLQAFEYVSVVAVTMSTVAWGRPVMASGANMAFRKDAFFAVDGYFDERTLASGDDQFLMEKLCARFPHPVAYVADAAALVVTRPASTLKDFLRQRLRWAGKWSRLQWQSQLLAVLVLALQVGMVACLPLAFYLPSTVWIVAGGWALKMALEWHLLRPVARFIKAGWNVLAFFTWQAMYPFYVFVVALFSRRSEIDWKDRTWRNQA